ncbi:MAG TPA: GNAT family N-acetyltransferase, partial [Candidatus Limnocylindria bacterium]
VAESPGELSAACALVHDAYVDQGLMRPHPSGLRRHPYQALPTTSTLVAWWGRRIVGTLTMIRDNPQGLPMESTFEVGAVRRRGPLAEISSLAVHRRFRSRDHRVLFSLITGLVAHAREVGVDYFVFAVHPNHAALYRAAVMAEPLGAQGVRAYAAAEGAPAVALFMDVNRYAPGGDREA